MERIFGLKKVAGFPRPIVTLGVFDGVHRGHSLVLREAIRWAKQVGGTSVVITFDRHPDAVLNRRAAAAITSLEHRLVLIEKAGIAVAVVLHFDRALAEMEPEDFAREIFANRLHAAGVLLGFNTRFGRSARGDAALLASTGAKCGFEVRTVRPLLVDGAPVSSTLIRNLITAGDLDKAARFLGRPVSLRGTVVHGDHRGKSLGFPTANLNLHHEVTPPAGVYVCGVRLDGDSYWGLANIGVRPTFHNEGRPLRRVVEVYIDGYAPAGSLYGKTLEAEILRLLRPEWKFDSPEALVAQMENDRRSLHAFRDSQPPPGT